MRGTYVVWPAIVLMSALSSAGAAQSAGADGARFAQSPQYPLLPRALEIELALSAAPKHLRDEAIVMERFKSGQYHAPSRAGIAYMLSPIRYRIDEHGGVTRTTSNPHLMFYGPNLK